MDKKSSFHLFCSLASDVDKICKSFLQARGLSYFHFRRIFKDNTFVVLSNDISFCTDFFKNNIKEPSYYIPTYIRQSSVYFWDECMSPEIIDLTREKHGLYHGITILSRRKNFYDCSAFAMPEFHSAPSSYYLHILKDLQTFSELFPKRASSLIEKACQNRIKLLSSREDQNRQSFFLPERSARHPLSDHPDDYITTYELLCLQLFQDGKSYKQIGELLSMSPRTVETHLSRLKIRTGLTLRDLFLKSFRISSVPMTGELLNSTLENGLFQTESLKKRQSVDG